jgi:hypothetical protein
LLATNFIPLAGELIIYDVDDDHPKIRAKIGDGETLLSALPWALDEKTLEELIQNTNTKVENLTSIWIGTKAQWEEAKANIATGTVVIITDDNDTAAGGAASGTTAKLGTAILGTMILGQEE